MVGDKIGKIFNEISSTPRDGTGKIKDLTKNHILKSIDRLAKANTRFFVEQKKFAGQFISDIPKYQMEMKHLEKDSLRQEDAINSIESQINVKDIQINDLKGVEGILQKLANDVEIESKRIKEEIASMEKNYFILNEEYTQSMDKYNTIDNIHKDIEGAIQYLFELHKSKEKEYENLSEELRKMSRQISDFSKGEKEQSGQVSEVSKGKTSEELKEEITCRGEYLDTLKSEIVALKQSILEKNELGRQMKASLEINQGSQDALELNSLEEKLKMMKKCVIDQKGQNTKKNKKSDLYFNSLKYDFELLKSQKQNVELKVRTPEINKMKSDAEKLRGKIEDWDRTYNENNYIEGRDEFISKYVLEDDRDSIEPYETVERSGNWKVTRDNVDNIMEESEKNAILCDRCEKDAQLLLVMVEELETQCQESSAETAGEVTQQRQHMSGLAKIALEYRDQSMTYARLHLHLQEKLYAYDLKEIEDRTGQRHFQKDKATLEEKVNDTIKKMSSQIDKDLDKDNKEYNTKTSEQTSLTKALNVLQSDLGGLRDRKQQNQQEDLQRQFERLLSATNASKSEVQTLSQQLEEQRGLLQELQTEFSDTSKRKSQLKEDIELTEKKLTQLRGQSSNADADFRSKNQASEGLSRALKREIAEKEQLMSSLEEAKEKRQSIQEKRTKTKETVNNLFKLVKKLKKLYLRDEQLAANELVTAEKELLQCQQELQRAKDELLDARIEMSESVINKVDKADLDEGRKEAIERLAEGSAKEI